MSAGLVNGKVALVTGGGSGIGRATALALAREGAQVVIGDIDAAAGNETVEFIALAGGEAVCLETDVTDAGQVEALVAGAVSAFGRLDCAFNNAGIEAENASTVDCTEEHWQRTLAVNLTGVWLCMKYEIAQMLTQGSGAVVNTSSDAGLVGTANMGAYTASKHAVLGLTKSAALEYFSAGIRVNAVCPCAMETPMIERMRASWGASFSLGLEELRSRGWVGRPEEVAEAVVWLCSDSASRVTGVALPVDGGYAAQ